MPSQRAPWWLYAIAAAVVLTYGLNTWIQVRGPENTGADFSALNLKVFGVVSGSPADKAGLQSGDVVVGLDGQHLGNILDWLGIATSFEVGKPYSLEVRRGQETRHLTLLLERRQFQLWETADYISILAMRGAQLISLALALLIVFKRPYDLIARLAGCVLGCIAAGNAFSFRGGAAILRSLPGPVCLLATAMLPLAFLGATAWFCLCAMFPRRLLTKPWHWGLALLPFAFVLPHAVWQIRWVYFPNQVAGYLSLEMGLGMVCVLTAQELAGLGVLIYNYRHLQDANERRKVGVLLLGNAIGLPGALITAILDFNNFLAVAGPILFLAIPCSFAYAVLRHRLFDLGVIVRQGLQYALARAVVIWMLPAAVALFLLDVALHQGDVGLLAAREFFVHSARGWFYAVIGALAIVAQGKRKIWLDAIDRRFFRERYDAQRLLRQVVEVIHQAPSFERVAPSVVAHLEAALHPEFAALLVREPREANYRVLAAAPAGQAPPLLPADSKLVSLVRLLGKPLDVSLAESGWLKEQLPHEDTDFLRRARIDLLVPVSVAPEHTEAILALGMKRSEEPYSREDQDLLVAIASSLTLLLERPAVAPARTGSAFEECQQCGAVYDSGTGRCAQEGAALAPVAFPRLLSERYLLERRLGQGGMGTVYRASDTALERRVAVKVIRDDLVNSGEAAERFRREARAAASFTHPNVVTVYDFGVAAGTRAFLVMELLEGASLRESLSREGRWPAARMVEILRGVSAAVDAAHKRQLIHRDLKPENIFLARQETREVAKVLDFGVAKFLPSDTQATLDTGTGGGVLVGTLRYMSPEQLRGEPPDTAWDLWALAVVAYEILTGKHPFEQRKHGELSRAILSGKFAPVIEHLPGAPARWQDFFSRAFALDRQRRPASANILLAELETALA